MTSDTAGHEPDRDLAALEDAERELAALESELEALDDVETPENAEKAEGT